MTTLALLQDCVARARRVPEQLAGPGDSGLRWCDALLADLDLALDRCADLMRTGEDLELVVGQVLQLKWLVYCALRPHLRARWRSDVAMAVFEAAARCDLGESAERLERARQAGTTAREQLQRRPAARVVCSG